jgi:mRNA-degrading endonuclease RelE of RelBE toxin-antitoxin system
VSYRLDYHLRVFDQAAGFMKDDRAGVAEVFTWLDRLTGDPQAMDAFAYGSGIFRARIGRYRVTYQIDEQAMVVWIEGLARVPS